MIPCTGWWQQSGYGRQEMHDLSLDFQGPTIVGQGKDIVAPFQLLGKVQSDGSVELLKRYEGRHQVLYVGTYDGEGTLRGRWDISGYRGEWSIRLLSPNHSSSDDDIQEIR
jgi:hypothetical protein